MLYHPKMGKLLAKEGNVTKVPVHTYGERERERERAIRMGTFVTKKGHFCHEKRALW